ncbi:hypothetical protein BASA81_006457 [Batrachochytrium salamandrivorans]|nr:hypothetical protein BASA81_006457 [Batrachochytrium salamandrivorans]
MKQVAFSSTAGNSQRGDSQHGNSQHGNSHHGNSQYGRSNDYENQEEEKQSSPMVFTPVDAPKHLVQSVVDTLKRPFAGVQKLKETLFSVPHFAQLGEDFPNIEAKSTKGLIKLHTYFGEGWGIVLTHPKAFEPVTLTELSAAAGLLGEFDRRGCKVCAVGSNSLEMHLKWTCDLLVFDKELGTKKVTGMEHVFPIPIIADPDRAIAHRLGALDGTAEDPCGEPLLSRAVFIIGPDRKLRFSQLYPSTCGRSFREILRVLDALQRTENRVISTPSGWVAGRPCLVNRDVNLQVKDVVFPQGVCAYRLVHMSLIATPDPQLEERKLLHPLGAPKPSANPVSMLNLGDEFPNFAMDQHKLQLLNTYLGASWGIICTLTDPFSPVCLTEMAHLLMKHTEQALIEKGCKLVIVAAKPIPVDFMEDVLEYAQCGAMLSDWPFAVVVDESKEIIARLGALDEKIRDLDCMATVARAVFVVGPQLRLRASLFYPSSVGRDCAEILRVIDSLRMTESNVVLFTPEGWHLGDECVADGSVDADLLQIYLPEHSTRNVVLKSGRRYFTYVKPQQQE